EMVQGLDLVRIQIMIAQGETLPISQDDVNLRGAAVECRIYAEDPDNNFYPSPGKILRLRTPSGPGVRDDSGVYEGWTVPIEYDPLISKLVAWGSTRAEAIARMQRALREYQIEGIKSNIGLFQDVLSHPDFQKGEFDTSFIDLVLGKRRPLPKVDNVYRDLTAIATALFHSERSPAPLDTPKPNDSPWKLDARRRSLRPS